MKSLIVEKDGSLSIREVPTPKPSPNEALVKTIACGMCGTDIKVIHQEFKGFPLSSYPLILGHEGVGEVVEIGENVTSYKIGDKVLLPFVDATDDMGSAYGAMSEYGIVRDIAAFPPGEAPEVAHAQTVLPTDLNPVESVLFVTFREVLSTVRYFGIKPEDSIVIYGCGSVGQTFIKFLSLLGLKQIIAVDIADEKLEIALALGAHKAFKNDVVKEVRAMYPEGVTHVLDAVGLPFVTNEAMKLLADRGNVLCYGVLAKEQITIDFSAASYNWNFICQQMPRKDEEAAAHQQVLEWIRTGKLNPADFISDYFEFDQAIEAYQQMLDSKISKKGIIKF